MPNRKTDATVEIQANGPDAAEMVSQIIRELVSNSYMAGQLYDVSRSEDGRVAVVGFRQEYNTDDETALGGTAEVQTQADTASDKPDNVVEMKPKAEPEDNCDCPACQLRRAIFGFDTAKPGSDRTAMFIFTPNGLKPL